MNKGYHYTTHFSFKLSGQWTKFRTSEANATALDKQI